MRVSVQKRSYRYRPKGRDVDEVRFTRDYYYLRTSVGKRRKWHRLTPDKRESEGQALEIMANLSRRRNGLAVAEVASEPVKAQIPIERHLADFESAKRAEKGGRISEKHIRILTASLHRIVGHCHFATVEAIDGLLVTRSSRRSSKAAWRWRRGARCSPI